MADVTWLDIMPAIPLARGVPVVEGDALGLAWYSIRGDSWMFSWTGKDGRGASSHIPRRQADTRVDLDDPQGFVYALRWLWLNAAPTSWSPPSIGFGPQEFQVDWHESYADRLSTLFTRYLDGATTEADKLTLAKACGEVKGG